MTNNVNIINNIGSGVDVIVSEINGIVQVVVDVSNARTGLSLLKPGDVFVKNGVQYIVCEQLKNRTTAVVRKECLDKTMAFGSNNNWKESNWREYLNTTYLKEMENVFGTGNIIEHEVDLLSLDGYDDYGISADKISVMNIDRYRKYHKYIWDTGKYHYLSTPNSTPSGIGSSSVQYVHSGGRVDWDCADNVRSVRPFFIIKS